MEHSNDAWSAIGFAADRELPRRQNRAIALAAQYASVKRQILFWRVTAVLSFIGLNLALGLILQDLTH